MIKNGHFDQKSKFWSKIEIMVKNRNFGKKSKFWSKIQILVKNLNLSGKKLIPAGIKVNTNSNVNDKL